MKNKEEMVRLQIEVTRSELKELKDMMSKAGLQTRKSLFNSFRALFRWAIKEKEAGRPVGSMDEKKGRFKELVMPALENITKANKSSFV